MLLKVALVALVFVAVHGQAIDNPEDRVANKPVARPRRGVAEELMKNLDSMARPLGPTNGRQRRSNNEVAEVSKNVDRINRELAALLQGYNEANRDEVAKKAKEAIRELDALADKLDAATQGKLSDSIMVLKSDLNELMQNLN
ncbi:hypothetical protein Q1695_010981 [Nippostrongylus brasiliensis]|nr:hypothetical protein Q1695_010981 [Nippostrongylus brasiliensis]